MDGKPNGVPVVPFPVKVALVARLGFISIVPPKDTGDPVIPNPPALFVTVIFPNEPDGTHDNTPLPSLVKAPAALAGQPGKLITGFVPPDDDIGDVAVTPNTTFPGAH